MQKIKFPDGFWWGAAMSAPQFEGVPLQAEKSTLFESNRRSDIWQQWFRSDQDDAFFNGVGPEDFEGFNRHWATDIDSMKSLGFNSMRLSISWSRLMPDGGAPADEAVSFYRAVFTKMNDLGIQPVVNLYHFDLPQWLYAQGGWEQPLVVQSYKHYAETAFRLFGDLVTYWTTFNEPIVPIEMGYLNVYHLPAVHSVNRAAKVIENTALAHLEAVSCFNRLREARVLTANHQIGLIVNLSPVYSASNEQKDVRAAEFADAFYNQLFLDIAIHCTYPDKLLQMIPVNESSLKHLQYQNSRVDFLGVNYYHPRRVQAGDHVTPESESLERFFRPYVWQKARINPHRGWEVYPKGLEDIALRLQVDYPDMPWYVAENGMGIANEDQLFEDHLRIEFLKEHLEALHRAIEKGSKCFGYHHWTFIDNWSWLNAFKNRYGFIGLELSTGKRYVKSSGKWFSEVIRDNGF